jgi:hypothetical protein
MICASIYLEKHASNLPAPPSTRAWQFLNKNWSAKFNSYAGKVTGSYTLVVLLDFTHELESKV